MTPPTTVEAEDSERVDILNNLNKKEDLFNKNIMYLSGGALGISLTFINDIVHLSVSEYQWAIATAWTCLTLTLLLNLLWQRKEATDSYTTLSEFNAACRVADPDVKQQKRAALRDKVEGFNKRIRLISGASIVTLIAGISLLIFFVVVNMKNCGKEDQGKKEKPCCCIHST